MHAHWSASICINGSGWAEDVAEEPKKSAHPVAHSAEVFFAIPVFQSRWGSCISCICILGRRGCFQKVAFVAAGLVLGLTPLQNSRCFF